MTIHEKIVDGVININFNHIPHFFEKTHVESIGPGALLEGQSFKYNSISTNETSLDMIKIQLHPVLAVLGYLTQKSRSQPFSGKNYESG